MKRIKKLLATIITSVMIFSLAGCNIIEKTPEAISNTVLAKVGDVEITRGEVDKYLSSTFDALKTQYGENFEEDEDLTETIKSYRSSVVDSLIEQEILKKIKGDVKIEYSDEDLEKDVQSSVDSLKETYTEDKKFLEYLKTNGYESEDEYKEYLREQLVLNKVAEKLVEDVDVTDEEVKKYYEENISSYQVKAGGDVTHILFFDKENGKSKAAEAREEIINGKTFDDIVAEYNDEKKCVTEDLGFVEYDSTQYVEEFMAGMKNLPEGEISQPIETSYGWHLIKVENISNETKTKSLDESKEEIKSSLLYTKQSEEYKKIIDGYKEKFKAKKYEDRI